MEIVKLGEIAIITAGQAAPKEFSENGYPFIRAGHLEDLVSGKGLLEIPKVNEEIAKKNRLKKLPKGSILFAKSGMSAKKNRIYISEEDTYFVSHLAAIFPSDNFDTNFLARYLNWYNPTNLILDDAYPSIRLEDINNLEIPLPSLQIQQKIAAILDKADELRQYNKKLIEKYDALTQSLFLDMFGDPVRNEKGWKKVDFNKLCDFEKTSIKPENIIDGENYIPLEAIEKVTGSIIKIFKVEKDELKSNKFYFTDEYILYGKLRPYLNKVALPNFSGICSTDIVPLKAKKNITNKFFITQIMRGSGFVSYCNERCSGANLPRISPKEIEKYQIINPPIELQKQFSELVKLIETQKQHAQAALAKSEALFQGLLQQAFKGELN